MAILSELYVATLTRSGGGDPGSASPINLIITDQGRDLVNERLSGSHRAGQANLHLLDRESDRVVSDGLVDGSVRLGLLGDDEWRPELVFVWGRGLPMGTVGDPLTFPLAINVAMTQGLSIDDPGALASVPVRQVTRGGADVLISRLLLIVRTGAQDDGGSFGTGTIGSPPGQGESATDNRISLHVVADNRLVVQHQIPDTPQEDLEGSTTNAYWVPVAVPFSREALGPGGIQLSIDGDDAWLPTAVFLFGFDTREGRPTSIVPLVHMRPWDEGALSTDNGEGRPSVDLTLEYIPRPGIIVQIRNGLLRLLGNVRRT